MSINKTKTAAGVLPNVGKPGCRVVWLENERDRLVYQKLKRYTRDICGECAFFSLNGGKVDTWAIGLLKTPGRPGTTVIWYSELIGNCCVPIPITMDGREYNPVKVKTPFSSMYRDRNKIRYSRIRCDHFQDWVEYWKEVYDG